MFFDIYFNLNLDIVDILLLIKIMGSILLGY